MEMSYTNSETNRFNIFKENSTQDWGFKWIMKTLKWKIQRRKSKGLKFKSQVARTED